MLKLLNKTCHDVTVFKKKKCPYWIGLQKQQELLLMDIDNLEMTINVNKNLKQRTAEIE